MRPSAKGRRLLSLGDVWAFSVQNPGVSRSVLGGEIWHQVRSDIQRVLNIENRGVDDLHRPEARGAFAAAFLALEREHEPSTHQIDVGEGADAGQHGRHDARRARTQYHDGAGHR